MFIQLAKLDDKTYVIEDASRQSIPIMTINRLPNEIDEQFRIRAIKLFDEHVAHVKKAKEAFFNRVIKSASI